MLAGTAIARAQAVARGRRATELPDVRAHFAHRRHDGRSDAPLPREVRVPWQLPAAARAEEPDVQNASGMALARSKWLLLNRRDVRPMPQATMIPSEGMRRLVVGPIVAAFFVVAAVACRETLPPSPTTEAGAEKGRYQRGRGRIVARELQPCGRLHAARHARRARRQHPELPSDAR